MKAKIEIEMDNAAFDPTGDELARILRNLANYVEDADRDGLASRSLHDINGNGVGKFEVLP